MENSVNKSVEYKIIFEDKQHLVKALIVSMPDEAEIKNINKEESKGFNFMINVLISPVLPKEVFDTSKSLVCVLGSSEEIRFGYIQNNKFVELEENPFVQTLKLSVLEVLMIVGETGHFIA